MGSYLYQNWALYVAVGKCYHLLQLEFMSPLKFHLATVKWLLILWVALVRFHRVLNFHWHSIQQGHVCASSSVVRNVEARYEERQKLTNCPETKIRKLTSLSCHLKKRWSADGRRTYCNQPLINCFRKELKSDSKEAGCSAICGLWSEDKNMWVVAKSFR